MRQGVPCHSLGMARSPKFPFLVRQGATYHARLDIPGDVQAEFGGRASFSRSTKLSDATEASCKATPWIVEWKAQIEAARAGSIPPHVEEIARQFAAETGRHDFHLLREVAHFVAKRLGHSEGHLITTQVTHKLDGMASLRAIGGEKAAQAARAITQSVTPFASKLAEYKAAHANLARKVLYEYCLDIERIGADLFVESFSCKDVQDFIDKRAKQVSTFTIKKQISALRSYWVWLAGKDAVMLSRKPFEGIIWPQTIRVRLEPTHDDFVTSDDDDGKPRFNPEQVCVLWEAANALGDIDLRDAFVVAAYTGIRRETIATLHRKTVDIDAPVPHIHLDDKSEAGKRIVPLHPVLLPILKRRLANLTWDGYLFRGGENKIGSRGARFTNPFRALLDEQGYGKGYGFHSFRRTLLDLLNQDSVNEVHAAKLVGHKIKTMSYGVYAGRLPMQQSLDILLTALRYPRLPAF